MGFCGDNVTIGHSVNIIGINNLYMYDNTKLHSSSNIFCTRAKFIMKRNSGAGGGLTVVTGNRLSIKGRWFLDVTDKDKDLHHGRKSFDRDIVVNEDVWIGTNVTLLSGTIVGRGAILGSGVVCRNDIPPYTIVIGNPAKVVGFRFTPNEIIEHEKALYEPGDRLSLEFLAKNYKKYFLDRIKKIAEFTKL